jgi:hypothetical protein
MRFTYLIMRNFYKSVGIPFALAPPLPKPEQTGWIEVLPHPLTRFHQKKKNLTTFTTKIIIYILSHQIYV